ncbi:MAG TPA: helix-turn-helix domain-containing protein [Bacteroidales bacterium]|nr:helix-turn-helix domain-containing protein [Bacteroidales bacterium]
MLFHICVRGNGGQSIFLENEDILHAIDLLAVFSHYYGVKVIAYQFLSNHYHIIIECEDPAPFMQGFRISYTKYFNNKYNSFGSVGRIHYTCGIIDDINKLEEKIIYVIRNTARHGIEMHPYCDSYNSSRYYFIEESKFGKSLYLIPAGPECELEYSSKYIPEHYLLQGNGHIYPRSFLDYKVVEDVFKTYANYMRKISIPCSKEIEENDGMPPAPHKVKVNDLTLSEMILKKIYPRTLTSLTDKEITALSLYYYKKQGVSVKQLSRVFGVPETTLRRRIFKLPRH